MQETCKLRFWQIPGYLHVSAQINNSDLKKRKERERQIEWKITICGESGLDKKRNTLIIGIVLYTSITM